MTNAIDRYVTPNVPVSTYGGQATAIEQSRAIAEVQAAIVVAQQCPRSVQGAVAEMRASCSRLALAERAFYKFPRGGQSVSGASVYLARELARCWGNIQYGTGELRRDDEAGTSEVQVYAWDVQTNTRSAQIIIVPHKRDKRGGPEKLVDLRDIYENNANNGARRLREAIFSVLPAWFVEEAKELCNQTLVKGDGKPLETRIAEAVTAFKGMGVTVDQLEQKVGRRRGEWNEQDVAQFRVTYTSLQRGEVTRDEEFPVARVTADEIAEAAKSAAQQVVTPPATEAEQRPAAGVRPSGRSLTAQQRGDINTLAARIPGLESEDTKLLYISQQVGREVSSVDDLTNREAAQVVSAMERAVAQSEPPAGGES